MNFIPSGWQYGTTSTFRKKLYDGVDMTHWHPLYTQSQLEAAVKAERERCAKIAELEGMTTSDVVRVIREGLILCQK